MAEDGILPACQGGLILKRLRNKEIPVLANGEFEWIPNLNFIVEMGYRFFGLQSTFLAQARRLHFLHRWVANDSNLAESCFVVFFLRLCLQSVDI